MRVFGVDDLNNQTFLVVEDEVLVRLDIVDSLERHGFKTLEASSADEALAILETHEISCVWTDIQMPGSMNGLQLAHRVREKLPTALIVVSSGNELPDHNALPQGAKFAAKPVQLDVIATLVRS